VTISRGIAASQVQRATWLDLPGGAITNSIASTPDNAAFALTDFTAQWWGYLDDTTLNDQALISQWQPNSDRAFSLRWANLSGVKQFKLHISLNGTSTISSADGAFPFTLNNGQFFGVRATRQGSTGIMKVYTSPSIVTQVWTLRGTVTPATSTGALWNSTKPLMVGGIGTATDGVTSNHVYGRCIYAALQNGYDSAGGGGGTYVAAADLRFQDPNATSWVDTTGKTWSVLGAADLVTALKAA
jgi:hypothetical protein